VEWQSSANVTASQSQRGVTGRKKRLDGRLRKPLIVLENSLPETAILLRKAEPIATATQAGKKEKPSLPEAIQEAITRETRPENQIKVPATLHNPHAIIGEWIKTEEREAAFDRKYGRTSMRSPITPLERRRRRIMSALFKALEERGFKVFEEAKRNYYHKDLWIKYEHDRVSFDISERIRQYRRELTQKEKEDRWYLTKQKFTQVMKLQDLRKATVDIAHLRAGFRGSSGIRGRLGILDGS
jgi:hypothetical protein